MNRLRVDFMRAGETLQSLDVAFYPPIALGDTVTIDSHDYAVVSIRWAIAARKTSATLGLDAAMRMAIEVNPLPEWRPAA